MSAHDGYRREGDSIIKVWMGAHDGNLSEGNSIIMNQSIQFLRRHSSVAIESEAVLDNESEAH